MQNDHALDMIRFFLGKHEVRMGTLPETKQALSAEVDRLVDQYDTKVLTPTGKMRRPDKIHLLNWIAAAFLTLPVEERDRLIQRGIAACEERQRSPRPIPFDAAGESVPEDSLDGSAVIRPPARGAAGKTSASPRPKDRRRNRQRARDDNASVAEDLVERIS